MFSALFWRTLFFLIIPLCYSVATDQHCGDTASCFRASNVPEGCFTGQLSCTEWCNEMGAIRWEVLNNITGHVRLHFALSPQNCCHESFKVSLYNKETSVCDLEEEDVNDDIKHSSTFFNLSTISNGSFPKEFVWEVDFISTGCYLLKIIPQRQLSELQSCYSEPISIVTKYEKTILADKNITISPNYNDESSELIITAWGVGFDLGWTQAISLRVLNESCTNEDHLYSAYIVPNNIGKNWTMKIANDKGKWRCESRRDSLKCAFKKVQPGNYCAALHLIDIRCTQMLWTPEARNYHFCHWFLNFSIYAIKTSSKIMPPIHHNYTVFFSIASALGILLIVFLIYIVIKIKLRGDGRKNVYFPSCVPLEPKFELTKTKLLLLYPRDCPLFMDTMTEFRKVLKAVLNAEVYDTWDFGLWEHIAEKGVTWALQYAYDPDIKIILVASQCSRFIYDALINGKIIEYVEPEPFDGTFPVTLKSILDLCVTQPYQRIYVIRLDGEDCKENVFKYISPFTVYTIPQQLNTLTLALKNLDSCETALSMDKPLCVQSLSTLVEKLNKYKIDNPFYFKNMIHTDESPIRTT